MKIDKEFKIQNSVGSDETRVQFTHTYLDIQDKEHPVLVATDGSQMAVVPVTLDDGDTEGYVSVAAIKESQKKEHRYRENILANGNLTVDGVSMPRPTEENVGKFPNWRRVYDPALKPVKGEIKLGLNPELLLALAKSLGSSDTVTLTIRPGTGECVIDAVKVETSKATGLIMPKRV